MGVNKGGKVENNEILETRFFRNGKWEKDYNRGDYILSLVHVL